MFDPIEGRGQRITRTKELTRRSHWNLASDGKKISMFSESALDRIEILDLQGGRKSLVELKNWTVQAVAWSPDNRHLYISGQVGDEFQIASVGLDGTVKSVVSGPVGPAWITAPRPSPDGRYLAFTLRRYETNVVMLENF
jgi:Tol biopolymer transport system component